MSRTVVRQVDGRSVFVTSLPSRGPAGRAPTITIDPTVVVTDADVNTVENIGTATEIVLQFGMPAVRPSADLFVVMGQSLTIGRSPRVTSPSQVEPTLFMFNGGPEAPSFTSPAPINAVAVPVGAANMASLSGYVPLSGLEGWGPGLGYQSARYGASRSFVFAPGTGSMSLKRLHAAHMANLKHGLRRAVELLRTAGFEPTIHLIFVQGHADADNVADGGTGDSPTSTANYLIGAAKLFASMRTAATIALGRTFTGPIWVTPLLTANSIASVAAKRDIVVAQQQMPSVIPGVRLLPPHSQFANLFETDLVHPTGTAYRYYAELVAAYLKGNRTPPEMVSKAIVSGKVEVTFDQTIALSSTTADLLTPGNSKAGFTVIDNGGAEVAVSAVVVSGRVATLTVASTAGLTGSWKVRNGLQQINAIGALAAAADAMPRTLMVGITTVGEAEDGTILENFSIPQEI